MKTLKKTLALVLALVMVVGTLAISASADNLADFTDADAAKKSDYATAADINVGLGIIKGMSATELAIDGTLTRAMAAKIAAYLALGETAADKLPVGATGFTDVDSISGYWANKFIAYCAAKGIIDGIGDNKFDPEGKLTGYAFAKIILLANDIKNAPTYNYFTTDNNGKVTGNIFTGTYWAINVAEKANASGIELFGNVADDVDVEAPISRGVAMQMVMNAISNFNTFAYKINLVSNGADDFGRPETYYEVTRKDTKTVSSNKQITESAVATPVKTYTTSKTLSQIAADLGAGASSNGVTLNEYDNSANGVALGTVYKTGTSTPVGGNGTVIEVYKTAQNTYSVVVVDTYVDVLEKADVKAAAAATSSTDAKDAYIVLDDPNDTTAKLEFKTADFAEGDVVLYTVSDGEVITAVKAAPVVGKVTAKGDSYVRVNGEKKELAAHALAKLSDLAVSATEINVFYDANGYIVKTSAITTATADATYDYIWVKSQKAEVTQNGSSSLYDASTYNYKAQAEVVDLETGALKVVDVAYVIDKNDNNVAKYTNLDGTASATEVTSTNVTLGGFYPYAVIDGKYAFGDEVSVTPVTLKKNNANIATGTFANAATVLKVVKSDKNTIAAGTSYTVTPSTGIANFPSTATSYNTALVLKNSNNVATKIYVMDVSTAVAAPVNYAVYAGDGETVLVNNSATATKAFVIGGESKSYPSVSFTGINKGDVVNLTITNGAVTAIEAVTGENNGQISLLGDTYAVIGGSAINLASDVTVLDKDNSYAKTTLAADKYVKYFTNSNGEIAFALVSDTTFVAE